MLRCLIPTIFLLLNSCTGANFTGQKGDGQSGGTTRVTEKDTPEEEGRTLPPADVNGAYLACESTAYSDVYDTVVQYGCNAYAKDARKLDLDGVRATWELVTSSGSAIDAATINLDGYSKSWKIPVASFQKNLQVTLKLPNQDIGEVNNKSSDVCSTSKASNSQVKFCMSSEVSGSLYFTDYLPIASYPDLTLKIYSIDNTGQCVNPVTGSPSNVKEGGLVAISYGVPGTLVKGALYCFELKLPDSDASFSAALRAVPIP